MIIMPVVFSLLLQLLVTGVDVCMFFLLIRLILTRRNIDRLRVFDDAGQTLVHAITARTGQLWYRTVHKRLSHQGELLVSLIPLMFAWLTLFGIAQIL